MLPGSVVLDTRARIWTYFRVLPLRRTRAQGRRRGAGERVQPPTSQPRIRPTYRAGTTTPLASFQHRIWGRPWVRPGAGCLPLALIVGQSKNAFDGWLILPSQTRRLPVVRTAPFSA